MIQKIEIDFDRDVLKGHINRFSETTIMVIGDIILDEYIWGDVSRISPEAPVPIVEVKQETKLLGGAANVVNNIAALGGKTLLCGVIGDDRVGQEIIDRVNMLNLVADCITVEPGRKTSIKTRVVAHNQQVVRFDRESIQELRPESITSILDFIKERLHIINAVIVADYGKGVVSSGLMKGLRQLVRNSDIIVAVDPKTNNFEYYQEIDVITPNHYEAGLFNRVKIIDEETLVQSGKFVLEKLNCRSALITQGKDGMTLFESSGEISHIPTVARKVFDVTGAGDTVISALCLGLASGMDLKSSAIISNFAAGIVVGEVGTSTVKAQMLKQAIDNS